MTAIRAILEDPEVQRLRVSEEQARAVLAALASGMAGIHVRRGLGPGRGFGPPEPAYPQASEAILRWSKW